MTHAISYQDYLESKRHVDLVCLNRRVSGLFRRLFSSIRNPRVLDAGTGTGLAIRRLIAFGFNGDAEVWGVEIDEESCAFALGRVERELRRRNYLIGARGGGRNERGNNHENEACGDRWIEGSGEGGNVAVRILREDFLGDLLPARVGGTLFDCVTAHAFMDMVPIDAAILRARRLLLDRGIFYSTINYDGLTRLIPEYSDRSFEDELLRFYDGTMDARRRNGEPTGGSKTGSLIVGALRKCGFSVLDCGPSDWRVFPRGGRYGRGERTFLAYLLRLIERENRKNPEVRAGRVDEWIGERLRAVEEGRLSLFTHQTDVLAVKTEGGGTGAADTGGNARHA